MDNNIIKIDEENLKNDLKGVIRKTIEESLTEMYLAGVSVRRVEYVMELLWGSRVSSIDNQ